MEGIKKVLKKIGHKIEIVFDKITSRKFLQTVAVMILFQYNYMYYDLPAYLWALGVILSLIVYNSSNAFQKIKILDIMDKFDGR